MNKKPRYEDISRISVGSYSVDVEWKYFQKWIDLHIEEYHLQMNPDFQRGHVWTERQQVAYVEFILRNGQSGRTIYFNCPGWMSDFSGNMVCVDGLQRITSVLMFLNNELRVFGHLKSEFYGNVPSYASFKIIINNLRGREDILRWYIELNEGGIAHSSDEIEKVRMMLKKEKST